MEPTKEEQPKEIEEIKPETPIHETDKKPEEAPAAASKTEQPSKSTKVKSSRSKASKVAEQNTLELSTAEQQTPIDTQSQVTELYSFSKQHKYYIKNDKLF